MRLYTNQHPFYCGIDLHARSMFVYILRHDGAILLHRTMQAAPEPFLTAIAPDRDGLVVAVVGDGGFMYSVNELATAVKYRLPVVFLIMNDDRYGAIKWLQQSMFQGRWGEADLANPDFPALARAFGARGERVDGVDALGAALTTALAADGPTVLELRMTVDPPWEI